MPLIKGKSEKTFKKNLKTEYGEGKPLKQSLAIAYAMKRKAQKKAMGGEMHGKGCMCPGCCDGGMAGYDDGGSVIGENVKSAAKEAFNTPKSSPATSTASSGVPATSDEGFSPEEAAKRQAIRKSYGYSKGGSVHNQGALLDEKHIMNEIDKEDLMTGEGYYLKESPFHKERIAKNEMADEEDAKRLNQHMVSPQAEHHEDMVDRIMMKRSPNFSGLDRYSEGGKVANKTPIDAGFSPNEFDDLVLRDDLESSYGEDDNAGDDLDNAQENKDRNDIVARIMASRKKKDRMPNPA